MGDPNVEYLKFIEKPLLSKATKIWGVGSINIPDDLGQVRWFGRWRKYCFFPGGGTVLDQGCLRRIAQFCEDETKKFWKAKRK
jgi:hypothetical protein